MDIWEVASQIADYIENHNPEDLTEEIARIITEHIANY